MPVLMLIAIVAVLVGVFFAATGRGGEMSYEPADQSPLDLGSVSAADIALLRPPTAMWGYNTQVTDEALEHIARAMRERDVKIAHLQEQLTTLASQGLDDEPETARALADAGLVSGALPVPGSPPSSTGFGGPEDPTLPDNYWVPGPAPAAEAFAEPDVLPWPDDSRAPEAEPVAEAPASPQAELVVEPPAPSQPEPVFQGPAQPEAEPVFETSASPQAEPVFETSAPTQAEPVLEASVPPEAEPVAGLAEGVNDPELPQEPELHENLQAHESPQPPQTPLVLKASAPSSSAEDREPTQSFESSEATQPSVSAGEPQAHDATQPSEIHAAGPQGAYDTHDWWAEQKQAAREEARRQAAGLEADDAGAQEQDR